MASVSDSNESPLSTSFHFNLGEPDLDSSLVDDADSGQKETCSDGDKCIQRPVDHDDAKGSEFACKRPVLIGGVRVRPSSATYV